MFDWLFEGRTSVYVLLGVTAVMLLYAGWRRGQNQEMLEEVDRGGGVLLYAGWQRGRKSLLLAGGIVACLIGLYFLLDRLVETDREQVRRRLAEMAEAVKDRDAGRIFAHVSERFSVWGMDRTAFRSYVENQLRGRTVKELTIGNITFPGGGSPAADGTLRVTFDAGVTSEQLGTGSFFVEATFGRDADGQWRMMTFEVSNPLLNGGRPLDRPPT